jgi:RNA polymerase sigma-70 factor (ECF subfamily)
MANRGDAETYEKHAEELLRFATVLVGPDSAPDVLSAAVLRAIAARTWPTVENRRAYLFRCVLNEARTSHRSSFRRQKLEVRLAPPEEASDPESPIDVANALAHLSQRQRAVVYFAYWEDQSSEEIASLLNISSGSVHRHLARARTHLRRLLGD